MRHLVSIGALAIAFLASLLPAQQLPDAGAVSQQSEPGLDYVVLGDRTSPYDASVVAAFSSLPVQHGGRVKPLLAIARTGLFSISHKRSVTTPSDETLGPSEWLLDTAFHPLRGRAYPVFTVTLDSVLQEMGLADIARKKRDRYSFAELEPGLARLFELAGSAARVEEKDRDAVQSQVVALRGAVREYAWLRSSLDFARMSVSVHRSEALRAAFPDRPRLRLSELLAEMRTLAAVFDAAESRAGQNAVLAVLFDAFHAIADPEVRVGAGQALAWFAPDDPAVEEWASPAELVLYRVLQSFGKSSSAESVALVLESLGAFDFLKNQWQVQQIDEQILAEKFRRVSEEEMQRHIDLVARLEALVDTLDDPASPSARDAASALRSTALAQGGDDAATVPLEVSYYRQDALGWAWLGFLFAFVTLALSWLAPRARALYRTGEVLTVGSNLLVTWGLVHRCLIMGRPPVANLYETFLFIACSAVWLGLTMEWINRRRAALSIAAISGLVGLWAGARFEVFNAEDTMAPLQAVLISNFWLSTHVVCITLGYAVALFCGLLGHLWILGKLFGIAPHNAAGYSRLSKQIYGTLCFSLIFTVVGTILGGIWAAESWGRFWGWDPKENGAFLIAVAQLFILHGRMGGYFKDWSVAMLAIATNGVVAFSWWYVNVMGVGLHSYGFSSAIVRAVWSFWGVEAAFLGLGLFVWLTGRHLVRHPDRIEAAAAKGGAEDLRPAPAAPHG
jgi:ABC-type transport system involved in cytochrome c biogenesis permease subunit